MFVYLVFVHQCSTGCPHFGKQVLVSQQTYDNSAYHMPDVRCIETGVQLVLYSVNGMVQ